MARGRLITIEGLDGAGKTTLAAALTPELENRGIGAELLREPGGVALSERIRGLVGDPALDVGARAEALLFAAARAQLLEEKVEPLLAGGRWVVLDRFVDSSLAYQGAGRELGTQAVAAINHMATRGLQPDRTLLLRVDPDLGRSRQAGRGTADRMELSSPEFFARVAGAYHRLAEAEPQRVRVLDATQAPQDVLRDAVEALADLLPAA